MTLTASRDTSGLQENKKNSDRSDPCSFVAVSYTVAMIIKGLIFCKLPFAIVFLQYYGLPACH